MNKNTIKIQRKLFTYKDFIRTANFYESAGDCIRWAAPHI